MLVDTVLVFGPDLEQEVVRLVHLQEDWAVARTLRVHAGADHVVQALEVDARSHVLVHVVAWVSLELVELV